MIRRLAYRTPFYEAMDAGDGLLRKVLETITSHIFSEFVLELSSLPPQLKVSPSGIGATGVRWTGF